MRTFETLPLPGFEPTESESIASLEVRPAKTRARRTKKARESMASEPGSSSSLSASLTNSDPVGLALRIALSSFVEESTECLVTWKGSATPAKRSVYRLEPLGLRTNASDYTSSVATPIKSAAKRVSLAHAQHMESRGRTMEPAQLIAIGQKVAATVQAGATVPTPRKNRWGLPDSHGKPFAASPLGAAIVASLGGATGFQALAATHQALMGYPPTWLSEPLKCLATQSSRKSRKASAAQSIEPKKSRTPSAESGAMKPARKLPKSNARTNGMIAHAQEDRGANLYETHPAATRAALAHIPELQRPTLIWEPSCGPGAIVRELRAAGHLVVATDLIDYGERFPERAQGGLDFFAFEKAPEGAPLIVTNPPYLKNLDDYVRHALKLAPVSIMLLRLAYLQGQRRSDIIEGHLSRIYVGKERLDMMHRDGWDGPKASSFIPFAWFVFERHPTNPGVIETRRISWAREEGKRKRPTPTERVRAERAARPGGRAR